MEIPKEIKKLIEKAIKLSVQREHLPYDVETSVTLVDDESIQRLNEEHRGINSSTDVLSFPLIEYNDGEPQIGPGDFDADTNCVFLGDIIISVEKVIQQAQEYGHSTQREFAFLAVHGILHLLGYDHEEVEDEKLMLLTQDEILNEMGLPRE